MTDKLDGKKLVEILTPLLGCYDKHFATRQWEHWAGVLGHMRPADLADSVQWWMNNRDQFPASPAALKSHAFEQVKKARFQLRELNVFQMLKDQAPSEEERIPQDQAKAYCRYIIQEIIEKKEKAPDRTNKLRWYESKMEDYYDDTKT